MREALDKQKLKSVYNRVAKRYDFQHAFFTVRSDQRGRKMVVEKTVSLGDRVLDCGAGTGSTALLAAQKVGLDGKVILYDMSDGMLAIAKERASEAGVHERIEIQTGDMLDLPFDDNSFDAVLSTYSMCPLYDPAKGALELYRVVKPGGRIGIAHSAEPERPLVKWLADKVENVIWHIPSISLGCRSVSVIPALEQAGCVVAFKKQIGVPLWPFLVFIVEKPAT
jgi:ubiquinone/menaquinone biosynthesis C-methylase UbiE